MGSVRPLLSPSPVEPSQGPRVLPACGPACPWVVLSSSWDANLVVLPAFVIQISAQTYVPKLPPQGILPSCLMAKSPTLCGDVWERRRSKWTCSGVDEETPPLRAARPLSPLTEVTSASPLALLSTFKCLVCDITLFRLCVCCYITQALEAPPLADFSPLTPRLGQHFMCASLPDNRGTSNKHKVRILSAKVHHWLHPCSGNKMPMPLDSLDSTPLLLGLGCPILVPGCPRQCPLLFSRSEKPLSPRETSLTPFQVRVPALPTAGSLGFHPRSSPIL